MQQNTKFMHSVRVPRIYKLAAKVCQQVSEGEGSIKQCLFNKKHPNIKGIQALVSIVFQRSNEIEHLLKRTKLFENEPRFDPWLAKIFISELLWGKKQLPSSECKPMQTILGYQQAFKAHLSDLDVPETTKPQVQHVTPRYVRVNTLIMPVDEAIELFIESGWEILPTDNTMPYKEYIKQISNLDEGQFMRDLHIKELLVFPPKTEFHHHPGYLNGALALQDRASCLPVHILNPPSGSIVLDMCAAPGMKTTQLAAALKDTGIVYAIEQDEKRFGVLKDMVELSKATCVKPFNKDVLRCDATDFPDVEYIIVDPSCSGSGIANRFDFEVNRSNQRLQKLAGFQIKILRSALTRYPKAKRVVYSTCSIHPDENEDVVRQVLETNEHFRLVPAAQFVNNNWLNYGSDDYGGIGKNCLYTKIEDDMTNGFFVAVFERIENENEKNEFFNTRVVNYVKHIAEAAARRKEFKLAKIKEKNEWRELKKSANNQNNKSYPHYQQNQRHQEPDDSLEQKTLKNYVDELSTYEAQPTELKSEETSKRHALNHEEQFQDDGIEKKSSKKSKRRLPSATEENNEWNETTDQNYVKKSKKHRKTHQEESVDTENIILDTNESTTHDKDNRKKRSEDINEDLVEENKEKTRSSKKHKKSEQTFEDIPVDSSKVKKQKGIANVDLGLINGTEVEVKHKSKRKNIEVDSDATQSSNDRKKDKILDEEENIFPEVTKYKKKHENAINDENNDITATRKKLKKSKQLVEEIVTTKPKKQENEVELLHDNEENHKKKHKCALNEDMNEENNEVTSTGKKHNKQLIEEMASESAANTKPKKQKIDGEKINENEERHKKKHIDAIKEDMHEENETIKKNTKTKQLIQEILSKYTAKTKSKKHKKDVGVLNGNEELEDKYIERNEKKREVMEYATINLEDDDMDNSAAAEKKKSKQKKSVEEEVQEEMDSVVPEKKEKKKRVTPITSNEDNVGSDKKKKNKALLGTLENHESGVFEVNDEATYKKNKRRSHKQEFEELYESIVITDDSLVDVDFMIKKKSKKNKKDREQAEELA